MVLLGAQSPALAEDAPPNDNRADAKAIGLTPFEDAVSTRSATDELGEPEMCAGGSKTVWYRYESNADKAYSADTFGSSFDTVLAVYEQSETGLTTISCNDDDMGLSSRVVFATKPGGIYYLQVGGYFGRTGDLVLHMDSVSSIAGTITNEAGDPLEYLCADAYTVDASPALVSRAYSDVSGNYVISLPEGSYKVRFSSCWDDVYRAEWYNDKLDPALADEVNVLVGGYTSGIDAALKLLGSISGTITSSGEPISTCVVTTDLDGNQKSYTTSDEDGTYAASGLEAGSYKVQFGGCYGSRHQMEWYNDKTDIASADPVSVTESQDTANIDADLSVEPPPANDDRAAAIPISVLPFQDTQNIASATEELAEPSSSCASSYNTVWYTLTVSSEKTVVVSTVGSTLSVATLYSPGAAGELVEKQCSSGSNHSLGFTARPGTLYHLQLATPWGPDDTGFIRIDVGETELKQEHEFTTTMSCAVVCPYWSAPTDHKLERERACAPTPDSPPGTWSDLAVTVPEAGDDGRVPSQMVFSINPSQDYDSFVCRASPDAAGKYFVATGANTVNETCPTLVIFGCEEDTLIRVNPGESYVLRVYNWVDTVGTVSGSYSFRLVAPRPAPTPSPGGGGGVIISPPPSG